MDASEISAGPQWGACGTILGLRWDYGNGCGQSQNDELCTAQLGIRQAIPTVTRTFLLIVVGEDPPPGSEKYPVIEGTSAWADKPRLSKAGRATAGGPPVVVTGVIDLGGGMFLGVDDLESPPGKAILAIFGVEGTSLAR
jgi:hypothetical protein